MRHLKLVIAAATVLVTGCATPHEYVRKGPSVPLEVGAPRTACEKANFLEVVPAQAKVTRLHAQPGLFVTRYETGTAEARGLAVYKPGEEVPLSVLPLLSGPAFEDALARHLRPMQPIMEAKTQSLTLLWGGLGLIGGGLTVGVVGASPPPGGSPNNALIIGGLTGVLVGCVVGMIGAWTQIPARQDAELAIRERMFFVPDDDPEDAKRAVSARNEQVRRQCESSPASPPGH